MIDWFYQNVHMPLCIDRSQNGYRISCSSHHQTLDQYNRSCCCQADFEIAILVRPFKLLLLSLIAMNAINTFGSLHVLQRITLNAAAHCKCEDLYRCLSSSPLSSGFPGVFGINVTIEGSHLRASEPQYGDTYAILDCRRARIEFLTEPE